MTTTSIPAATTVPDRNIREELRGALRLVADHWAIVSLWFVAVSYVALLHYAKSRGLAGWFGDGKAVLTLIPFQMGAAAIVFFVLIVIVIFPAWLFTSPGWEGMTAFRTWLGREGRPGTNAASVRSVRIVGYCLLPLGFACMLLGLIFLIPAAWAYWNMILVFVLPPIIAAIIAYRRYPRENRRKAVFGYLCYSFVACLYCAIAAIFLVELLNREPGGLGSAYDASVTTAVIGLIFIALHVPVVLYLAYEKPVSSRLIAGVLGAVGTLVAIVPPTGALLAGRGLFLMGSGGEMTVDLRVEHTSPLAHAWIAAHQNDGPTRLLNDPATDIRLRGSVIFDDGDRVFIRPCHSSSTVPVRIKRGEILESARTGEHCPAPQGAATRRSLSSDGMVSTVVAQTP